MAQLIRPLSDIEDDFVKNLSALIPYYLHEDTLKPKQIHGQTLKGKDLLHYFKVIRRGSRGAGRWGGDVK